MLVILHVIIALSSIGLLSVSFARPSMTKLLISYGLVAATIASGVIITVQAPAHMLQSCVVGVIYLAIASVGIIATHTKLARRTVTL